MRDTMQGWYVLENPAVDDLDLEYHHWGGSNFDNRIAAFGKPKGPLFKNQALREKGKGRFENTLVLGTHIVMAPFVGAKFAGKTQAAQSLVNALGGSIWHTTVVDDVGDVRTKHETNVIYGMYTGNEYVELATIALLTHAGHDTAGSEEEFWSHHGQGLPTYTSYHAPVLVFNPFDDRRSLDAQLADPVEPLIEAWSLRSGRTSVLFSRCNSRPPEVTDEFLARLKRYSSSVYYADNADVDTTLANLPVATVACVVDSLRTRTGKDLKLICFSGKRNPVPDALQEYVVHFGNTPFNFRAATEEDSIAAHKAMTRVNLQGNAGRWI